MPLILQSIRQSVHFFHTISDVFPSSIGLLASGLALEWAGYIIIFVQMYSQRILSR